MGPMENRPCGQGADKRSTGKVSSVTLNALSEFCREARNKGFDNRLMLEYLHGVAVIQDDNIQKRLLEELIRGYVVLEKRVDGLLKNTLPEMVANVRRLSPYWDQEKNAPCFSKKKQGAIPP